MAADVWAGIVASFLGSGFRVPLPREAHREEAAAHERRRVEALGELVGEQISLEDWTLAVGHGAEDEIEVVGGWPRSYGGPSMLWVAALPASEISGPAAVLPMPAHPRPTDGLPTLSRLADSVALAAIRQPIGIWADPAGVVLTSTDGPVIALTEDRRWAAGRDSSTWAAERLCVERGAARDLTIADLDRARRVEIVGPEHARAVDYVAAGTAI